MHRWNILKQTMIHLRNNIYSPKVSFWLDLRNEPPIGWTMSSFDQLNLREMWRMSTVCTLVFFLENPCSAMHGELLQKRFLFAPRMGFFTPNVSYDTGVHNFWMVPLQWNLKLQNRLTPFTEKLALYFNKILESKLKGLVLGI